MLNALQKSIVYPTIGTAALGAIFGINGAVLGMLATIPVAPILFYNLSTEKRSQLTKAGLATFATASAFFSSVIGAYVGDDLIHKKVFGPNNSSTNQPTKPKTSSTEAAQESKDQNTKPATTTPTSINTPAQSSSSQASSAPATTSKYTREETIQQYIVFLNLLKADGAASDGMGGLETRSRATDMLKAAGFDPSLMENIDRKNAWDEVFGRS